MKLAIVQKTKLLLAAAMMLCVSQTTLASEEITSDLWSIEQIKADFKQLYNTLQAAHFDIYANLDKQSYDTHYRRYLQAIDAPMTEAQIRTHFQRFVALGDIAHANLALPINEFMAYRSEGGTMLPLFIAIRDGRVLIDEVYSDSALLQPGQTITAINGQPIEQWLTELSALVSADNQALANTIIEAQFPFLMWVLQGPQEVFSITTAAHKEAVKLPSLSRDQQQLVEHRVASRGDMPLTEREAKIMPDNIGYLRPGPFYNTREGATDVWDASAFKRFINEAFERFIEQDVGALLIDLRSNPGGTNAFSDPMLAWFADQPFRFASSFQVKVSETSIKANEKRLAHSTGSNETSVALAEFYQQHRTGDTFEMSFPLTQPRQQQRFDKPVYVLIDRYSYSNAVTVAAMVQDYGFGTVIGEATADLATTYGAMEHFSLDNTGIEVGYPKALIVRPNGDTTPAGVTPDVLLDGMASKDDTAVLEDALKRIKDRLILSH